MLTIKPPSLSVSSYLLTIDDAVKRSDVEIWFKNLHPMFEQIQNMNLVRKDPLPEILIRDSDLPEAEGSPYAIYVSRGLVDYCYELTPELLGSIKDIDSAAVMQIRGLVPTFAFRWMIAHEYFHGARAHNDRVQAEFASGFHTPSALHRGTEYDADLMAVSDLHRRVQFALAEQATLGLIQHPASDLLARQVSFSILFIALRRLPHPKSSDSHPNLTSRLLAITAKLAAINAMPSNLGDWDMVEKETYYRADVLTTLEIDLEINFQKLHGHEYGNLLMETATLTAFDGSHIDAWNALSRH